MVQTDAISRALISRNTSSDQCVSSDIIVSCCRYFDLR
jgi:hypothetical protein